MKKSCDFCVKLRPVVFCEADAAYLCLPCDSKVHSANALSKRHLRILICELCRNHSAYLRCADHQKFMCRGCDDIHHDLTSNHKKQIIFTYTGCPSAKELAEEWGFDLSDLESSTLFVSPLNMKGGDNVNVLRQFNSQIGGSSVVSSIESLRSSVSEEYEVGSSNSQIKANKSDQRVNNSMVRQQVPDLRKLQQTEGNYRSSKSDQEQVDASSTIHNTDWKTSDNHDQNVNHPDFQLGRNIKDGMTSKPYTSVFSQMDQLVDILNGDSFWQSKCPLQSNQRRRIQLFSLKLNASIKFWIKQLWSQNMQDLGVCDELRNMEDLDMPDFDLTFQNYEELFKGQEEPKKTLVSETNNTYFDPSKGLADTQAQYCSSAETEGLPLKLGETIFISHKDKRGSRHEKQAGYTSFRKMKIDAMKRVKSKVSKAEGSDSRDANDVMTRKF